jgi:hypothetical protein
MTSWKEGRCGGDGRPSELAADGLASSHRWALERPEGKNGSAEGDREEVGRGVAGLAAGTEVAAGIGVGGGGVPCGEGGEGEKPSKLLPIQ